MSRSRGNTTLGSDQYVNARRTESYDAASVVKLSNSTTEQTFGRTNIINLIERANLAVSLVNQDGELMGQACFLDYPNLAQVDPGSWEPWLKSCYNETSKASSVNTLFLHFFVAKSEYSHGAAQEIITTAFNAVPEIQYIYLLVPKNAYPESALSKVFTQVELDESSSGIETHVLFVCGRDKFVPMLHIRQARVQDHDDLTPIFDRQSDMLTNTYGGFFLAELIEAQDETMHCLVAENEGTAIGFMSLCSEVNLDLLNDCFDLGPLHGLKKAHEDDLLAELVSPEPTVDDKPVKQPENLANKESSSDSRKQSPLAVGDAEVEVQRRLSEEMLDYMSEVSGSLSTSRASSVLEKIDSVVDEPTESTVLEKTVPQLPKSPPKFVPQYHGESNAFSIQLFCIDEKFEMRSIDLLRAAFSRMPDKDFAVITVPHLVPEFPLLQKFLRVTPRVSSTLPQELYVFHRAGITEDFVVRDAVKEDTQNIERLVGTLTLKENLLTDLRQYLAARRDQDGTELRVYVAEVANQIVGVAILRREEEIEYVRSHYNIEDFIYFNHHSRTEHGHLHHFALNPIFNHYSKHFLKEVMRKAHKTSLYYPIYSPGVTDKNKAKHSMLTCMSDLVPVRPRRQIIYPLDILEDRAPSKRVLQKNEPYALCHINRKLTLEPKVVVNARIVVVGASTAGIAYLETLAFCPHLKFNNLILISPHGLPGELPFDQLQSDLLGTEHCYNTADHSNISLRTWVSVVYGKMTKIDRSKKHVYVNDSKLVPFDHLVIATGEQHQYPMPTGLTPEATIDKPPQSPDRYVEQRSWENHHRDRAIFSVQKYTIQINETSRWFVGTPPKNLYVVNDDYDSAVALYWAEKTLLDSSQVGKVVVHGGCLRAYCTVRALMTLGIKGENLSLVLTPTDGPSCFNNPVVETAVKSALEEQGVELHEAGVLAEWQVDEDEHIRSLTFLTPEGTITTECRALFSYTKKRVDLDAFTAVNDACLVFDGKLVIDSTFHTNDISIRAVGSVTKYQRRYYADQWTQKNFNSKEVGIELASSMLSLFDPTLEPMVEPDEDPLKLIPIFRSPKVQSGILPGNLHYLHVGKPSLDIPLAIHMLNPEYGTVLSTGEPVGKTDQQPYANHYFRLHLNSYNTVETITCLSKEPIDESNILCLFGVHQRFLNNVNQRYREGLISDFYSFFREAWSLAIYHDRFSDFRDEIRELLVNQPTADVKALEEKVRLMIDEDLQLNDGQRKTLQDIYSDTSTKRSVETRLLSFLSYNYYHLPMYAKPGMV